MAGERSLAVFMFRRIQERFYQKISEYGSNYEKSNGKKDSLLRRNYQRKVCMVG
jgi:hypothetical protein